MHHSKLRDWLGAAACVVLMITLYFIAPFDQRDDPLPLGEAIALTAVIVVLLCALIAGRLRKAIGNPASVGVASLVVILALVIVAFSSCYFALARSDPGQVAGLHTRLDSLYFTLTTLATIGYGDIHPSGQAARAIACVQIVFNVVFVGGLVRVIFFQVRTKREGALAHVMGDGSEQSQVTSNSEGG